MSNIPEYYTHLFNRVTDAIEELRAENDESALEILIDAQFEAEELYIRASERGE